MKHITSHEQAEHELSDFQIHDAFRLLRRHVLKKHGFQPAAAPSRCVARDASDHIHVSSNPKSMKGKHSEMKRKGM